jgi:hypothetical protein
MRRPRRFGRLLALLAFVSILGLVASPASARQPQREVIRQAGSFLVDDCGGGVLLTETFTEVATITTFFDASGNPIRVQVHVRFDGVIFQAGPHEVLAGTADFCSVLV